MIFRDIACTQLSYDVEAWVVDALDSPSVIKQ